MGQQRKASQIYFHQCLIIIISRADSWRARVSHICELQVNLSSGAMKIDFGGLDRWDYDERHRNMQEAEGFVTASNRVL